METKKNFRVTASDAYLNHNVAETQFSGFNYLPMKRLLAGLKGEVKIVVRQISTNNIVATYTTTSIGE